MATVKRQTRRLARIFDALDDLRPGLAAAETSGAVLAGMLNSL